MEKLSSPERPTVGAQRRLAVVGFDQNRPVTGWGCFSFKESVDVKFGQRRSSGWWGWTERGWGESALGRVIYLNLHCDPFATSCLLIVIHSPPPAYLFPRCLCSWSSHGSFEFIHKFDSPVLGKKIRMLGYCSCLNILNRIPFSTKSPSLSLCFSISHH